MKQFPLIDIARRRFFIKSLLWMMLLTSPYSSTLGQIMNNLPKNSSVPFIEPPMPDDFEGLTIFCNFAQSPNYQHTIWQCLLTQQPSTFMNEAVTGSIQWQSNWIIPITTDGKLASVDSSDAFHNLVAAGKVSAIGTILAINNQNEWVALPLAGPPSAYTDNHLFYFIRPSSSGPLEYDVKMIIKNNLSIIGTWGMENKTWLISQRLPTRGIPFSSFILFDQTGNRINHYDLKEFHIRLGTIISRNGDIIHWGIPADHRRDKTLILCQSPDLKVITQATIDHPPDQQLIGLALPNDKVLLLRTEVKDNHPVLTGWIIHPEKDCQTQAWGTILLPSHFDYQPIITWLKQAIILPTGEVVIFYTQQWDVRNIDFERSPSREITRASLWALKFNPLSQQIIWDRLVISSEDPASEAFSINLTDNTIEPSMARDPGLSLAYLPNLDQIWINPTFPQDRERLKYFPYQPRIYRLDIK